MGLEKLPALLESACAEYSKGSGDINADLKKLFKDMENWPPCVPGVFYCTQEFYDELLREEYD